MQYKLLTRDNTRALNGAVTEHLNDGWELYGSPTTTVPENGSYWEYAQAVTFNPGDSHAC